MSAQIFAQNIETNFQKIITSKNITGGEIKLFRALINALKNSQQTNVKIEEYHGANYQVKFTGNGSYARASARCELSDLLIISFNSKEARLTYLQAKYENTIVASIQSHKWKANLEQWFLLNQLPSIKGYGKFDPPSDLLSSATLKSIGSFGFFHKDLSGVFDFYYASAEHLSLPRTYSQRAGKLVVNRHLLDSHLLGQTLGIQQKECLEAINLNHFLNQLYNLQIGTPIDKSNLISQWIINNLKSLPTSPLINQLLLVIDPNQKMTFDNENIRTVASEAHLGAKKIILIKIDDGNVF